MRVVMPQVYEIDGRWYLIFSTLGRFLSPGFARRFRGAVPERSNFSMVGDSPFGPFHIHGTGQIVRHRPDDFFYAAQLVHFRKKWAAGNHSRARLRTDFPPDPSLRRRHRCPCM